MIRVFIGLVLVATIIAVGVAFGGVAWQAAPNAYRILVRPEIAAFPAVVVQPRVPGVMAFDVLPRGNPEENSDNGFAWNDTCDVDLIETPDAPVVCARVGIKSDRVEVGVRSFNGAKARPVHIIFNGQTKMIVDHEGVSILGDLKVSGQIVPIVPSSPPSRP